MMKHVAIFFAIFCVVHSQRPPYAGSADRSRYPQVLPQYLEAQQAAGGISSLGNRINVVDRVTSFPSTTTAIPFDLPVDALGDIELINRIKTWPREKQPFWYLNWIQIQEHRGDMRHRTQTAAPTTQMQTNYRSY
ncbi:uncharacterized protein LOC143352641 [Halictus rubicundus]|uniref:uncharacterized protein LOC143352641 n=1 Tax=Halictus rubicundus TaxID=77578 RepID=UPI004036AA8C